MSRGRRHTTWARGGADAASLSLFCADEFKGHSLLQAAREADVAKVKKTLALEIISFKHPQTNETALVRLRPPPETVET